MIRTWRVGYDRFDPCQTKRAFATKKLCPTRRKFTAQWNLDAIAGKWPDTPARWKVADVEYNDWPVCQSWLRMSDRIYCNIRSAFSELYHCSHANQQMKYYFMVKKCMYIYGRRSSTTLRAKFWVSLVTGTSASGPLADMPVTRCPRCRQSHVIGNVSRELEVRL